MLDTQQYKDWVDYSLEKLRERLTYYNDRVASNQRKIDDAGTPNHELAKGSLYFELHMVQGIEQEIHEFGIRKQLAERWTKEKEYEAAFAAGPWC